MADLLPPITAVLNADIAGFSKGMTQAGKEMSDTEGKGKTHFGGLKTAAVAGMGGDLSTTRVWWDK